MLESPVAILLLLSALNLVNYLDRYLVMAVSTRIEETLHLNDTQTGWVTTAFMLGYFITSPIFGRLGDKYSRKSLMAAGIAVWSVATVLSGLAPTYGTMIAARVVVGVGEASYATLAPTIIDDLAPSGSKNRWLAVFYVAIPVGSALGFIVGGQLERYFGWRQAFFIAGGPGLLLALSVLLIREVTGAQRPRNAAVDRRLASGRAGEMSVVRELFGSRQYVSTVVGYVAQTFALGGFAAWAAPFLYRKLCLELHNASSYFGAITVVTGLAGTAIGGVLGDRLTGGNRTRGYLRVCAWTSVISAPFALLALLTSKPAAFLFLLGASEFAAFVSVSPVNAAVLHSVRPELRATAMAVSIFAIHLFGDMVSQPLVGAVSDTLHDPRAFCAGAAGLQVGLYTLPLALVISAVAWFYGTWARDPVTLPDTA